MKSIRDTLADVTVELGAAAVLSSGSEQAVRQSLTYVRRSRARLAEVEARLQTVLRATTPPPQP